MSELKGGGEHERLREQRESDWEGEKWMERESEKRGTVLFCGTGDGTGEEETEEGTELVGKPKV